MKYLKIYENFFYDTETKSTLHEPVLARPEKPEEIKVGELEPNKPNEPEPEPEPKSFKTWLKHKVKEIIEFTETDNSNKAWVKINNGVSVQWEISMEEYPMVSASFKFGPDTVYLDDYLAGKLAKEFYTKQREYNPKTWASFMIASAKSLPDLTRDWKKRAINRATDQDHEFSIAITDILNKKTN